MISALEPYPAMKDSGVPWLGEVPEHWVVRRLKTAVRNVIEQAPDHASSGLCVALEHVEGWTGRLTPAASQLVFDSQLKAFRAGDVLFGKLRPYLAKVTQPPSDGACVGEFLVLRARTAETYGAYMASLVRSKLFIDAVNSTTLGAKMPRAEWGRVGVMGIPLPPLPEQTAIVRFLDYYDRRIRRYIRAKQKLLKLLEEEKQAIIHRAVTGQIDVRTGKPYPRYKPSGVEWLGDVPEGWEVRQISHFAAVGNGSTPSRGNATYWSGGTFPWLNSGTVNSPSITAATQFVTGTALRECHLPLVPAGSVLVAITGQGKTRGTAAVLKIEATINQHLAYIRPRSSGVTATPEYLRLFLQAAYPALRRMSDDSGSTKGALTCEDLRHFRVALLPRSEQVAVVAAVAEQCRRVEAVILQAGHQISLLREYRTRLIADVVTGKLDVRDAAAALPDEPEEAEEMEEADALADEMRDGEGELAEELDGADG